VAVVNSAAMQNVSSLDRVYIFNNELSLLVPHEWIEEVEDDHYLYHDPGSDSGWLRVSLVTSECGEEPASDRLSRRLNTSENVTVEERTGNRILASEKDVEESGDRIHIYYWKVFSVVALNFIYEAVFSYTVLANRTNDEDTRKLVKVIGQVVSQSQFSAPS
jgi:hypothetical protein